MGALTGCRVLDLSRILAGPFATQTLADLGATVIKVERPGSGDDTRHWGPPFVTTASGTRGDAAYFFSTNRGKRSITVDYTKDAGRELILRIAEQSDVLVENFKVGGLAPYGLDAETLRARFPRLIYCSITGFGQTGPYAPRPGYDALIQGMGGLMSITGEPDGAPGAGPQKVGVAVVDVMTGLYASNAILAALLARERTGVGAHIDIALLDVQVAGLVNQASNWLLGHQIPQRMGSGHPSIVPYQPFPCADGYVMLAIGNQTQFSAFCAVAGAPEIASNPLYSSNEVRVHNRQALIDTLTPLLLERTVAEWLALGEQHGFPCGPINSIDRVFADEQVVARELVKELPSAEYGSVKTVASPMRFDGAPACANEAPPALGEGNIDVLTQLGYSADDIARLKRERIL